MFYEHVDTRISSLRYIKLKHFDTDIKTKSISKTCTNYETKGKPRKMPHRGIEPACMTKTQCARSGTVQRQTNSATMPSISRSVIICTVQVNWTSWLRQNNDEKCYKITKICLSETEKFYSY